jgi:Fibronectin type 3 domain-containing protein
MTLRKVLVLLAVASLACGKRGDPHPPVPVIPKATTDLLVAQRGPKVLLSWSYPSLTTAGKSMTGIRRVIVWRTIEELPVSQPARDPQSPAPGNTGSNAQQAIQLFARVPPLRPAQFLKLRTKVDSLEAANLPAATSGARLTYEDTPPLHAADGRPVRANYAVVTEGASATSDLSNVVSIVPLDVPVAPGTLAAAAKKEGIVLTWTAPDASVSGSKNPLVAGYNVYRFPHGQPSDEFATPVNTSPVSTMLYTDVPPYGPHDYFVTALAAAGSPRIESEPSAIAGATFKDLVPPSPPGGLTALVETGAVRLVWDAVDAADLAGYKVYRTEGTGIEQLRVAGVIPLTPQLLTATNYRDTAVNRGISYYYEVVSVDKTGNESAKVKTDWVLVPKTP